MKKYNAANISIILGFIIGLALGIYTNKIVPYLVISSGFGLIIGCIIDNYNAHKKTK